MDGWLMSLGDCSFLRGGKRGIWGRGKMGGGADDVPDTSECGLGVSQQGDSPERPGEESPGT